MKEMNRELSKDPMTRFIDNIDVTENGCWQWLGWFVTGGYGGFWIRTTAFRAHRLAYMILKGDIPDGLHLDHLCRNRACVNPDHIEAVTAKVNVLRGDTIAAKNKLKTHCPANHPYSPENTYIIKSSMKRQCRKCTVIRSRKRDHKKRLLT